KDDVINSHWPSFATGAQFFFTCSTHLRDLHSFLHDALPISTVDLDAGGVWLEIRRRDGDVVRRALPRAVFAFRAALAEGRARQRDRKSTRLNSSHVSISYAVLCLKKKMPSRSSPPSRTTGWP